MAGCRLGEVFSIPGEKNCYRVRTASQRCLVAADMGDRAEHADCVVRGSTGGEGVEMSRQDSRG
jgi:hypothetical protein